MYAKTLEMEWVWNDGKMPPLWLFMGLQRYILQGVVYTVRNVGSCETRSPTLSGIDRRNRNGRDGWGGVSGDRVVKKCPFRGWQPCAREGCALHVSEHGVCSFVAIAITARKMRDRVVVNEE